MIASPIGGAIVAGPAGEQPNPLPDSGYRPLIPFPKRNFPMRWTLGLLLFVGLAASHLPAAESRPNIVFLLADDLAAVLG